MATKMVAAWSAAAAHHLIKFPYPHFELILAGDLAPPLLDVSFEIISRISLGTNHLKIYLEKYFRVGTLLNTNETFFFPIIYLTIFL